ncbi:MAG: fluoride efflux transporter CrcB [Salibacteraceae bacterium]
MNIITAIAIFIGGGLGSLSRFGISLFFQNQNIVSLPWATLSSNIISTTLLGIVMFKYANSINPGFLLLITVGFCGGFSTFSTFSLETFQLIRNGQHLWAALNIAASVGACLIILYFLEKSIS